MEPPSPRAVHVALRTLTEIDAVAVRDEGGGRQRILLRPLGFHLASLPVDARLGKLVRHAHSNVQGWGGMMMLTCHLPACLPSPPLPSRLSVQLIVGAVTDVLEPILTMAAALSYKLPFATPFGKQEEAWRAKQRFASSNSDHLAVIEAYKAWTKVRADSYQARKQVSEDHRQSRGDLLDRHQGPTMLELMSVPSPGPACPAPPLFPPGSSAWRTS